MILVPVFFYQFWDVGAEAFIDDITSMFQSRVTIFLMNERLRLTTASGNVTSMREPLNGSLWWYWIAANVAKRNGASFKNYHRLSHLFSIFVECR